MICLVKIVLQALISRTQGRRTACFVSPVGWRGVTGRNTVPSARTALSQTKKGLTTAKTAPQGRTQMKLPSPVAIAAKEELPVCRVWNQCALLPPTAVLLFVDLGSTLREGLVGSVVQELTRTQADLMVVCHVFQDSIKIRRDRLVFRIAS